MFDEIREPTEKEMETVRAIRHLLNGLTLEEVDVILHWVQSTAPRLAVYQEIR